MRLIGANNSQRHCADNMTVTGWSPARLRDDEDAFVSVNGNTCWTKTLSHNDPGTHECGSNGHLGGFINAHEFTENSYRVTCTEELSGPDNRELTVRVWTNLDDNAHDESFGIDNVVVTRIPAGPSGYSMFTLPNV